MDDDQNQPTQFVFVLVWLARSRSLTSYEAVVDTGENFPQTRIVSTTWLNLGGHLPIALVDRSAAKWLRTSSKCRQMFNKEYEIDLERREVLKKRLNGSEEEEPSQTENEAAERGWKIFNAFEGGSKETGRKRMKLKTNNELVDAVFVTLNGKPWCKLSTTVRCGGQEGERRWDIV